MQVSKTQYCYLRTDCTMFAKGVCPTELHFYHVCNILTNHFALRLINHICDRIWENPACSEIYEFFVSYIFDKLYHNLPPSFRLIARFA